jgi:hypothetical protein
MELLLCRVCGWGIWVWMKGTGGTNRHTRNHSERIAGSSFSPPPPAWCNNRHLNWVVAFIRKFSFIYRKIVWFSYLHNIIKRFGTFLFVLLICIQCSVQYKHVGLVSKNLFVMEWELIVVENRLSVNNCRKLKVADPDNSAALDAWIFEYEVLFPPVDDIRLFPVVLLFLWCLSFSVTHTHTHTPQYTLSHISVFKIHILIIPSHLSRNL